MQKAIVKQDCVFGEERVKLWAIRMAMGKGWGREGR